jgi:hypothetical protein
MDRAITAISRRSSGLSAAHVALIKLLAEVAVDNFLREVEAGTEDTDDDQQVEGITRCTTTI